MTNVDAKKANKCIIPASNSNLYDKINNQDNIGNVPFTFDGTTLPINTDDLLIKDSTLNISIEASYNNNNPYIKIIGLQPTEIDVYASGTWSTTLTYSLPSNFKYDTVNGLETQKVLNESIILANQAYEETICGLAYKIYGGAQGSSAIGFSNLWLDSVNGNDNNDGYTKTKSVATLTKIFSILGNSTTGEELITVHIAPGDYNITTALPAVSFDKIEFIGYTIQTTDKININIISPLVFMNSQGLAFRNLNITNNTNTTSNNGLALTLIDCGSFELSDSKLLHAGDSVNMNDTGIISLINSNGAIINTEISYTAVGTNTDIGEGAVRVSDNASFSWNNTDPTCHNLQHLVINKEGYFFAQDKINNDTNAFPYSPDNTIGYYARATTKTVYQCQYFDTHNGLADDTATATMTMNLLTLVIENHYGTLSTVVKIWTTGAWQGNATWAGSNPNLIFTNISDPTDTLTFAQVIAMMFADLGTGTELFSATSGGMVGTIRIDSEDLYISGSGNAEVNYSFVWVAKMFKSQSSPDES
jgi:hypothetical protein